MAVDMPQKIIMRNSTGLSLNDRFSQVEKVRKREAQKVRVAVGAKKVVSNNVEQSQLDLSMVKEEEPVHWHANDVQTMPYPIRAPVHSRLGGVRMWRGESWRGRGRGRVGRYYGSFRNFAYPVWKPSFYKPMYQTRYQSYGNWGRGRFRRPFGWYGPAQYGRGRSGYSLREDKRRPTREELDQQIDHYMSQADLITINRLQSRTSFD